ncbi:FHA domain-containing protein [Streptomyces sp. NPDC005438]|uniref:FHA domain-containing protein n=1 Tax=Streptomyces sp. NPDC005438 TaxID=3156880 RepID=UPI0033B6501F
MQIRLTVVSGPRAEGGAASDVLVTAPAGTPMSAVLRSLRSALPSSLPAPQDSPESPASADTTPVYVGRRRLDPDRQLLGEPPLLEGALLSLHAPSPPTALADPGAALTAYGAAKARLRVVAGPDAGGVHLLQGGRVLLGRSADADVPLDDPDVSRLHCAITVSGEGAATVIDLGSTNGTTLDGVPVGDSPRPFRPGATLRLGQSALRLAELSPRPTAPGAPPEDTVTRARAVVLPSLPNSPDGEGRLVVRLSGAGASPQGSEPASGPDPHSPASEPPPEPPRTPRYPPGRQPQRQPPRGQTVRGLGGTDLEPSEERPRARGLGSWARRIAGGRPPEGGTVPASARPEPEPVPEPEHPRWPDPATLLLTALGPGPRLWERGVGHPDALTLRLGHLTPPRGPAEPLLVDLARDGSLGVAGPRPRLMSVARSLLAQLTALHPPSALRLVLLAPERGAVAEWSWLGWLPHLRPRAGQDCRLLLAHDRRQTEARVGELLRELEDRGDHPPREAPSTVLVVDGDPGTADLRRRVARLVREGPHSGVRALCLGEAPAATATSPAIEALHRARESCPVLPDCTTVAQLSGDVATSVRLYRCGPDGEPAATHSTSAVVDAVSPTWTERFARALAPLREPEVREAGGLPAARTELPRGSRLLDELGLARATPTALLARWSAPGPEHHPGRARVVLGAGVRGPVGLELTPGRPHLGIRGQAGTGKSELLRVVAASLAAGERPGALELLLVDGRGESEGLAGCAELPHVSGHLVATEPGRMREFAQSLSGELKRRAALLDGEPLTGPGDEPRVVAPRRPSEPAPTSEGSALDGAGLSRLVVLVDDLDILLSPALGNPGRPAAGSVVRALEGVVREGARLGVHLVMTTGRPELSADSEVARAVSWWADLSAAPAPVGRGVLSGRGDHWSFQGARVTGRIPRTGTLRPTVVPWDWARAGDSPARRPVRELGNGPTDLALLASAVCRAAESQHNGRSRTGQEAGAGPDRAIAGPRDPG